MALCDPMALRAACGRAAALAGDEPRPEPAAIVFAFASVRRAFPFAWKVMAQHVAHLQAQANGLTVAAPREELDARCVDVLYPRAEWDAVRAWFDARVARIDR